ncbi:MAG: NUDIX domain-containing protein [Candidatus Pacearchaeota archaeon]
MFDKIINLMRKKEEKEPQYREGIFLVVYKIEDSQIKYLILKRILHWKGWEFPKGGKETGETDLETVFRELKEETGLKPVSIMSFKIKGNYHYSSNLHDRIHTGQTYTLYAAEVKGSQINYDEHEHEGYMWANYETAVRKLTWPNQKLCLKKVNKKLEMG